MAPRGRVARPAGDVQAGEENTRGLARSIDLGGALLVETPQGLKKFFSGEVTVRPRVSARDTHDTLLVDIGNTRVKWARLVARPARASACGRACQLDEQGLRARDIRRCPRSRLRGRSVASRAAASGSRAMRVVTRVLRRHAHPRRQCRRHGSTVPSLPPLANARGSRRSSSHRAPRGRRDHALRASRGDSARIGWSAPSARIGSRGRRAVCVIGVGTALTLDLVDARGRHRGGAIVPAPELMKDSLLMEDERHPPSRARWLVHRAASSRAAPVPPSSRARGTPRRPSSIGRSLKRARSSAARRWCCSPEAARRLCALDPQPTSVRARSGAAGPRGGRGRIRDRVVTTARAHGHCRTTLLESGRARRVLRPAWR